jgi:hydrogenase nickel incorporation protein HypB
MFQASSLVLVNKIDLLPHLKFDIDRCVDNIRKVNPEAEILLISASSGEGMDRWYRWIDQQSAAVAEQAFV